LPELQQDLDAQDIVTLNLTRAVQVAIDIAAHILSKQSCASPQTMGEAFELLADLKVIDEELCQRMKGAVGFRNMAVHDYGAMSWTIVFAICQKHLADFKAFAHAVMDVVEE
jgi:uncharacterized protein YutE (UPF0331/DUF86 family)